MYSSNCVCFCELVIVSLQQELHLLISRSNHCRHSKTSAKLATMAIIFNLVIVNSWHTSSSMSGIKFLLALKTKEGNFPQVLGETW